ncbi:HIT-like domain-containing protein [Scenedesmus sp. NREL 46B-D3]|nr:HIT-like domain-containing protein [Scenedesmus sp. NREL 46B-D3]
MAAAGSAAAAAPAGTSDPPVSVLSYRWTDKNVFNAINEGRFPADKVFDRPHYYALLDKMPVTRGHALLITKHPVATLLDSKMPPEAMADAMGDLQALTRAVQTATGCAGVRVRQNNGPAAGQVVPQLHFHVIPVQAPGDEVSGRTVPFYRYVSSSAPLLLCVWQRERVVAIRSSRHFVIWCTATMSTLPTKDDVETSAHYIAL